MLPKLVFFDTEFTSWKGSRERNWSEAWECREVVQIGAVAFECGSDQWKEIGQFECLVFPHQNPHLSDYFIRLTGITNDLLAKKALPLKEALESFRQFALLNGGKCFSWGHDEEILWESSRIQEVELNWDEISFSNASEVFQSVGEEIVGVESGMLHKRYGIELGDGAHDAVFDSRSVGRSMERLLKGREWELNGSGEISIS